MSPKLVLQTRIRYEYYNAVYVVLKHGANICGIQKQ